MTDFCPFLTQKRHFLAFFGTPRTPEQNPIFGGFDPLPPRARAPPAPPGGTFYPSEQACVFFSSFRFSDKFIFYNFGMAVSRAPSTHFSVVFM